MNSALTDKERIILGTNEEIGKILGDELPILSQLKEYVIKSGGKRVRSLVACYLAQMYSGMDRDTFKVSAVVEIIHAASLLHDDVLDDANVRRGKPSGKNLFGSKEVILGGDYMFATAIRRLNDYENPALMDIFTRVIRDLAMAELFQLAYEKNPEITMDNYFRIIYGKTGSLFQTACEGVAIQQNLEKSEIELCADIGKNLGMIFQIRDDYLDYFNSALLDKLPFQDFENGLYTFPVLYVREKMNEDEQDELMAIFNLPENEKKTDEGKKKLMDLLEKKQAQKICLEYMNNMAERLLAQINQLPEHEYRSKIENQVKQLMQVNP